MLLDLGKIIAQPGGVVPFALKMDFSQMEFGGSFPASQPVEATGQVRNEAGVLVLTGTLDTVLHCTCDRCATSFQRPFHQAVEAILVPELMDERNEDDWTFLLSGDKADLEDILTTAFVLNMDSKFLCSPDCKGLCGTCGKNLNEGPCDCKPEPDPRLAVLKQLLKDKA
jgi:uncharacterized protein